MNRLMVSGSVDFASDSRLSTGPTNDTGRYGRETLN